MCLIFNFFYKISYDEQDMNQSTVSANEHDDVFEAATKYFESLRSDNIDVLADIFHKYCVTYGTVNSELVRQVPPSSWFILLITMEKLLKLFLY
jgi:hypothetical protein